MPIDRVRLDKTLRGARAALLALRTPAGYWEGQLSSSALSTATAAWALHTVDRERGCRDHAGLVRRGLDWLAGHPNADGGWGDTVLSKSNPSTTLLAWSALAASDGAAAHARAVAGAEAWLRRDVGGLEPERIARAVDARYGNDRTFSAPILTTCALAGRLGPGREAWRHVLALPFELAACPHAWWKWLRLPVVSYALPALIAIGQVRHHFRPTRCPPVRLIRNVARGPTLRRLTSLQPPSGGFLEAAPLTSFVTMSLAAAGHADHPVVAKAAGFLAASVRDDGSWPIDTNLATWVTTLAVNALAAAPDFAQVLPADERRRIVDWLLGQQHLAEHPYTRAAPGGWAWTDLSGGVPDADDTAGALLALRHLAPADPRVCEAVARGAAWLLGLQNRDGGIPTFCRGWGKLPFDRSAADLTAHAVAAWAAWLDDLPPDLRPRAQAAITRALAYLERTQAPDGTWAPLWFGCQDAPDEGNPTYGTARVVAAMERLARQGHAAAAAMADRGARRLLETQNADGGWGGAPGAASSIEETALAVVALAEASGRPSQQAALGPAIGRGAAWMMDRTHDGADFAPSPIGFYFAKLWYFERLYPVIFAAAALERVRALAV